MKKIGVIALLIILASGTYYYINLHQTKSEVSVPPVIPPPAPTMQAQEKSSKDFWVSPEGKTMGYIKSVSEENGKVIVGFDYARIFFGDDVALAMEEDGECSRAKDDCLNISGYHIRNKDETTDTLIISPGANVTPLDFCTTWETGERPPVTVEDFVKNFKGISTCENNLKYAFSTSTYPYWIKQNSTGEITEISQQFIP